MSDFGFEVTRPWTPIDLAEVVVTSAKKYIKATTEGGFTVNAATSATFEQGAILKSGDSAGLRRPDKTIEHLWLSGSARVGRNTVAAFLLHYENGRFAEAKVWDVAGWPTELRADYGINAIEQKRLSLTKQEADEHAAYMDSKYNDGEVVIMHQPRWLTAALDYEEWVADMCPNFIPRKRPVKRASNTETASFEALKQNGEWAA